MILAMSERRLSRRSVLRTLGGMGVVGAAGTETGQTQAESWPQFGYDTANSGHAPGNTGLDGDVEQQWSVETFDSVLSAIAVANGKLYFGNRHGVYVLNAGDGREEWIFAEAGVVSSTPTVVDGSVYFGSHDDHVYALDASAGTEQWSYETGNYVYSSPVVRNGTVVVGSGDGNVYALDAATGAEVWTAKTGGPVNASPALVDGTVYIGSRDGVVYALDASDGTEQWTVDIDSGIDASPAVADGQVYVASRDGAVNALSIVNGSREWTTVVDGTVKSSPAVADNRVYLGTGDGIVYALNTYDGAERWSDDTGSAVYTSPIVVDGNVYVGNADGYLVVYDRSTGDGQWITVISLTTASSPAVVNGTAYVGGADGTVYAFREQSDISELIETPRPMSTPVSPPPGPDSLPPTVTTSSAPTPDTGSGNMLESRPRTQRETPVQASNPNASGPVTIPEYLGLAAVLGGLTYALVRTYIRSIDAQTPTSGESPAVELGPGVTSWLVPGAYPDHSAAVTAEPGPVTAPTTAWKMLPDDSAVATAPAVVNEIAYTVTDGGDLLAIDVKSGDIMGRTEVDMEDPTPPVVADERLFLGGDRGVVAFPGRDGDHQWGENIGRVTTLLAAEGALYVGGEDSIRSLGFEAGDEDWQTPVDDAVVSMAVDADTVYAATATTVVALDRTNGDQQWVKDHQGRRPGLTIKSVLIVSTDRAVSFRDPDTGVALGHESTDTGLTPIAVAHDRLYHVTESAVRAVDTAGDEVWRTPLDVATPPVVVGKTVYVGTDSDLVALDVKNGDYRFTHDMAGAQSRPVVVGNTVLCPTADGALTAIAGELGEQTTSGPSRRLSIDKRETASNDKADSTADGASDNSARGPTSSTETVATAFARDCERVASATVVADTGPVHVYDGRFVDDPVDVNYRMYALDSECDEDEAASVFLDTARQWRGISKNTHIATVAEMGEGPRPWVAFDPGVYQLDSRIESLEMAERVDIVTDLAEAIRTAGMYNVVHGALRPEVVYLSEAGAEGLTAIVADWGLQPGVQRAVGDTLSPTPYTAPEQLDSDESNSQTDIYRLGAVAQYVLTGTEPFADATRLQTAIPNGNLTVPSERAPALPAEVDAVIATAMADDPDQRFASPYDFNRQLRAALR